VTTLTTDYFVIGGGAAGMAFTDSLVADSDADVVCVDLMAWMERSRLNAARGIGDHISDPAMRSAVARFVTNLEPALRKLERLQPR
jgi:hypothetical protein